MTNIVSIPFHIGDFLSGTLHMDTLEKGAYIMLLMAHYQRGEEGLPDDNKMLSRIAGVTMKVWQRIRPVLEEKFIVSDSRWVNKKCVEVLRKVHEKSSQNSAKALKRHNGSYATALPMQCKPKTNNQEKEKIKKEKDFSGQEKPPDKPEHDQETSVKAEALFAAFWQSYPLKIAESKARVAFLEALETATETEADAAAEIMDGLERYKAGKPDWMDFAQAATWLRDRRWRDEWPPDHMDEDAAAAAEKERIRNMPRQPISENLPGFLRRDAAEMH